MVDDELEPLITRCPNCSTRFRVTESQLAVASGRVRCGACLTVFQGTEHLVVDQAAPSATDAEPDATAELDAPTADEWRGGEGGPETGPSRELPEAFADEEIRLFGGYEEDTGTGEVDFYFGSVPQRAEDPAPTDADAALPAGGVEDAEGVEESVAEADNGIGDEPGGGPDEAAETPAAADSTDADYERWLDRDLASIDQLVEEVVASGRAATAGRSDETTPESAEARPGTHADAEEESDTPPAAVPALASATAEISFAREPRRWWALAAALFFVLLLAVQIAYLQLPDWSREPSLRPAYELVCGWLHCELPEMRALKALRTRNLVVRSHPGTSGALIVDAAIVNTASYAQRFPDLELRFTSVNGELVAGRRFPPDEYLPADFEGERSMPPDTPIQVSLEIVDPGPDAVNYTLSFR